MLIESGDADFVLTDGTLSGLGSDWLSGFESAILIGGTSANTLDATGYTGTLTLDGGQGDDTLLGGSGPNTIYGGGGNDVLVGGALADFLFGEAGDDVLDGGLGIDWLDGGDDDDGVLNYEAHDTHLNIEWGFPSSGGHGRGGSSGSTIVRSVLYRVQSAEILPVSCAFDRTILRLPDLNQVSFEHLCGYRVSLEALDPRALQELPYLASSALQVHVTDSEQAVHRLPEGTKVSVSFALPALEPGQSASIWFWDQTLGTWIELPTAAATGFTAAPLNDLADGRMVLVGTQSTAEGRIQTSTNFAGSFALVVR